MEKTTRNRLGCLGLIFIPVILFFIFLIANRPTPDEQAASDAKIAGYTAESRCRDAVRAGLKAPATAEFQAPRNASITKLANGNYRISSYVDAQNGFGAKVRTPYVCTITPAGSVVDLQLGN